VPYDFDFSGLVNTGYGTPDEGWTLNGEGRLYRGLPITTMNWHRCWTISTKESSDLRTIIF